MGLVIHSLEEVPSNIERNYYLYLLDYGWKEPLSQAVIDNFGKIADQASKSNAVFIKGTSNHVDNEILSWHHINGEDAEDILPAILITTLNPHLFRDIETNGSKNIEAKIIVIPLRKCCKSSTEVITLINKIFRDINDNKELQNFLAVKEIKKGIAGRILDGVILQPNFHGIGFNLKTFFSK